MQTLAPIAQDPQGETPHLARANGFSLHAGVAAKAWERDKLERLCRYITRPPVADKRLSLTPNGNIRYELKTLYRDGTTHVILEPMDFMSMAGRYAAGAGCAGTTMARLAALVPRLSWRLCPGQPAAWADHARPAGNGGVLKPEPTEGDAASAPRRSMTWAQRLRQVFDLDVQICEACGGPVRVIASIQDPGVVKKILDHLGVPTPALPPARAPPEP